MKIGVLGAGVSGLSFGKIMSLKSDFDIELLESKAVHGGIARTRTVEDITYHPVGGHCFNSKFPDVMSFVFDHVLAEEHWHKVQRNANIRLMNYELSYPIEYAVKQIYACNQQLAIDITKDFLNTNDTETYLNLEDWFRKKFGDALSDIYFLPYNTKIWNRDPKEMSHEWVEGKLPIPDKKSFFKGLISQEKDTMPHASFYYPDSNDQNTFLNKLADGLHIIYNYKVDSIFFDSNKNKWILNNDREYDIIVSTLPLNIIPSLLTETPENILTDAARLKYNKVTTMLWETAGTDKTWTYIPEASNFFHRYIHIGNFFRPQKNYSITEAVGYRSYKEMVENGKQDSFLQRPVDYNVSDHAYVVFDENVATSVTQIKRYLADTGIHTLGRFGEWEYYNMDVCIKKSLDLAYRIIGEYNS